jgi:hypothetical protein
MRIAAATLLALLALLVPTAGAAAARVPPGNSGAIQYSETVPGAGGEEGTRESVGQGGKPSSAEAEAGTKSAIPTSTSAELEKLGPEGEAALNLADSGATSSGSTKEKDAGKGKGKSKPGTGEGKDRGKESAAAAGAGGSGTPSGGSSSLTVEGGNSGAGEVLGGAFGTSGGGLGFLQLLILATVVVGAGAYLVERRRRDRTPVDSTRA